MGTLLVQPCVWEDCGKPAITDLEDEYGRHPTCRECLHSMGIGMVDWFTQLQRGDYG